MHIFDITYCNAQYICGLTYREISPLKRRLVLWEHTSVHWSVKISEQIYYVYEAQYSAVYLIIHYSDNYYCYL